MNKNGEEDAANVGGGRHSGVGKKTFQGFNSVQRSPAAMSMQEAIRT
jgi:hypothetical protein